MGEPVKQIGEDQNSLKQLSNKLATHYEERDKLKARLKVEEDAIRAINHKMLLVMQREDMQNFKTPRGTFYINTSTRARVVNSDHAFPFLKEIGCAGLIKETVNASSLSATVKELVEQGKSLTEFEEHGIDIYVDESVRLRGRNNDSK